MKTLIICCFIVTFLFTGCDKIFNNHEADKNALYQSCAAGYNACVGSCSNSGCQSPCDRGRNVCIANLNNFEPSEWQPADAFYDGCMESVPDGLSYICTKGQSAASCASASIVKKYGTTSQCP